MMGGFLMTTEKRNKKLWRLGMVVVLFTFALLLQNYHVAANSTTQN